MNSPRVTERPSSLLVVVLTALLLVAACSAGGAASPAASSGSAGGSSPSGGTGATLPPDQPVSNEPSFASLDPGLVPKIVVPRPGTLNPKPVAPTLLEPAVDGRHVVVRVSWYSGVEPCYILDSVDVKRTGTDIEITVLEGSGPADQMCIEIAELKATIVDLGELEPGTYTISAPGGDAPPVTVTVG